MHSSRAFSEAELARHTTPRHARYLSSSLPPFGLTHSTAELPGNQVVLCDGWIVWCGIDEKGNELTVYDTCNLCCYESTWLIYLQDILRILLTRIRPCIVAVNISRAWWSKGARKLAISICFFISIGSCCEWYPRLSNSKCNGVINSGKWGPR